MFDMGFLPDIRKILKCVLHQHQTLLFSATMPDSIQCLVREILHNPITVQIDAKLPAKTVSHAIYPVQQHLKTKLLKAILNSVEMESVLVFTRTRYRAYRLMQQLLRCGHQVKSIQGNLPQTQRQAALDGFRNGLIKILVATDIAARGIDVLTISHVINFDIPESPDDYIHRIGRTGRIQNHGKALTFVTKMDTKKILALEKLLGRPLRRVILQNFNYSYPASSG
jgi:ATP-dependent RNA helicase RhlE